VRIDDYELCPRFSAVVFENVHIALSPYWLQYRLMSVGLNPINNIVDITNFVMAELAQPMHAFDRDKLRGDRLVVRPAHEGETLLALDDTEYTLTPADGVVADQEGAVSIAGIIGGRASAISDDTTNIVFESANWKATQIRKTSARLKLRTDASMRFEKAQDPVNTVRAIARAIALMKIVCPGARLAGGLTDDYRSLPQPSSIRLRLDVLNRKLGREVPEADVRAILERLAFHVHSAGPGALQVTVPSFRATKDIAVADDLVEEVGRMVGYDIITPVPPAVACTVPPDNVDRMWHRELRALLTARGFTEVYNYSFLSDEQAARFQLNPEDQVRVRNPIASDQNLLRSSLIPGIFANLELNAKHFASFRMFEIGREIHNRQPAAPLEITHLVAALYNAEGDGAAGLFELKRIAEAIAPGCRVAPDSETLAYEHPARTGTVRFEDSEIGRIFEAHPNMLSGRAAILDLNLDRILELRQPHPPYRPLRRLPSSAFDLTLVAPPRDLAGDVEKQLAESAGPLLESVSYKYEFPLPSGRGMTFHFVLRAPERTLSSEEINAVRENVIEKMRALGYDMRV
jgi:phenylalanyl-tRNA synthetase beta chain